MVAGGRGSTWTAATSMAEGAGQRNGYLFCGGLLDRLGHVHPVNGRVGWRRAEEPCAESSDYSGLTSALDALLE